MKSLDVAIHSLWIRKDRRKPYTVRWKVAGRPHAKAHITRALADSYRSELMQAARRARRSTSSPVCRRRWRRRRPS